MPRPSRGEERRLRKKRSASGQDLRRSQAGGGFIVERLDMRSQGKNVRAN